MAIYGKFLDGSEFAITFKRGEATVLRGKNKGKKKPLYVASIIHQPKTAKVVIAEGGGVCSFQDKFDSKVGRIESLKKALHNSTLTPGGKNAILKTYFTSLKSKKAVKKEELGRLIQDRNTLHSFGHHDQARALMMAKELVDKLLLRLGARRNEDGQIVYGKSK